jgi:DNA-binding response OmpR family regulator
MLKVMVIEDDPKMRSLLTTLLNLEGFLVRLPETHTTEDLIHEVLNERPEIALVDVNLNIGSGLDLVRAIRREPEIKDICVLMSSGLYLKKECTQAGANGFIMKPYMPDELIKQIHQLYQKQTNITYKRE